MSEETKRTIPKKDTVIQRLRHPDPDARGCTRWWWFGCAVKKEEIVRELDLMREAGIGGVELQILYPLQADDPEQNIRNHFYLSPEYLDLVRFACDEAAARGMTFDMTPGSSWPFGGPFVPKELSAPNVIPYTIDVHGPLIFDYDFTTRLYGDIVGCVMGKMEQSRMLPETIQDLTEQVTDKYLFGWPWGKELRGIRIPEGDYKIVVFLSNDKRQTVLKPLPGGDGLIIDHERKEALRLFLTYAGDPLIRQQGTGKIRAFFCDSLEVFGQNWTDILYGEFRKRRGYELRPYLYALWGEIGEITDRIRYDFHKTLAELTEENFYREFAAWCRENGVLSRIQAHGTWGDILLTYGAADIPEGETFSEYDRYEVNTVHRRLATSAAHLYGKPVVSNESFTWLRSPRFLVTLEQLKAAADSIFLDGINQIFNHGYAYSEENNDGHLLSTPFYASTQINHQNTWWPYYHRIAAYINRVSDWLRQGEPVVRTAVYLPQSDIWAENPISDIHMAMKLEERLTTEFVDAIQKAGYWFDFINDEALSRQEKLPYHALILAGCSRIPMASARAIKAFARSEGIVLCKGRTPHLSCGMKNAASRQEEIQDIFRSMEENGLITVTKDSVPDLIRELKTQMEPDLIIAAPREKAPCSDVIGYVHRRTESEELFFFANISSEEQETELTFPAHALNATYQPDHFAVFDPMQAEERRVTDYRRNKDGSLSIRITFEPFDSLLFLFSEDLDLPEKARKCSRSLWMDLSEGWEFSVPSRDFRKTCSGLSGWEKEDSLRYFSGEGIYRTSFSLTADEYEQVRQSTGIYLRIEHLGEAAEVFVNGQSAGIILKRPYTLDIKKFISNGENLLEIHVRNLLINSVIDPEQSAIDERDYSAPVTEHWPYETGRLNRYRQEFLYPTQERKTIAEPLSSGIRGNVTLEIEEEICI